MTQVEFQKQLQELNQERRKALSLIEGILDNVKSEIAQKNALISELTKDIHNLKAQRLCLQERFMQIEREWSERRNQFIKEHQDELEREWDKISTYTIVRELRRRGWEGDIFNNDPDIPQEHKEGVTAAFKGHNFTEDKEGAQ